MPIFCLSSVTGSGLEMVRRFLHLLPPGAGLKETEKLEQEGPEFQVDELFDVPGVGTVAGGLVTQGIITEGMTLNLGPDEHGRFNPVKVTSIRRSRAAVRLVRATQSAALAIDAPLAAVRRGMSLVDPRAEEAPTACQYFQAKVCVLYHPTAGGFYSGFRASVHIGNIRQTAAVEGIFARERIGSNDQASVVFRFQCRPEYVKVGQRLLFRDGRTKGIGRVTQVFPYERPEIVNR